MNWTTHLYAIQAYALCFPYPAVIYWLEEQTWKFVIGIKPGSILSGLHSFISIFFLCHLTSWRFYICQFWRPEQSFCIAGPSAKEVRSAKGDILEKAVGNNECYDIRSSFGVQVVQVALFPCWVVKPTWLVHPFMFPKDNANSRVRDFKHGMP